MTRELIRRSCGHLEAAYLVGSGLRRIREREGEPCGICRSRRAYSASPEGGEKPSPKESPKKNPPDEVARVLKERRQSNTNDSEGGSER